MLGGADNTNGELPAYITGANTIVVDLYYWTSYHYVVSLGNGSVLSNSDNDSVVCRQGL